MHWIKKWLHKKLSNLTTTSLSSQIELDLKGVNWSWTNRIITVPKIKVTWEINILKDLHISETRKARLKQKEYVTFNELSWPKHCTATEMHQTFNITSTVTHAVVWSDSRILHLLHYMMKNKTWQIYIALTWIHQGVGTFVWPVHLQLESALCPQSYRYCVHQFELPWNVFLPHIWIILYP